MEQTSPIENRWEREEHMDGTTELRTRTSDLIELAILAARYDMPEESQTIRKTLEVVTSGSCLPMAVEGLCWMHQGRYSEAIEKLSSPEIASYPDSHIARQYLAMAYRMTGMHDRAEEVIAELKSAGTPSEATAFLTKFSEMDNQ